MDAVQMDCQFTAAYGPWLIDRYQLVFRTSAFSHSPNPKLYVVHYEDADDADRQFVTLVGAKTVPDAVVTANGHTYHIFRFRCPEPCTVRFSADGPKDHDRRLMLGLTWPSPDTYGYAISYGRPLSADDYNAVLYHVE